MRDGLNQALNGSAIGPLGWKVGHDERRSVNTFIEVHTDGDGKDKRAAE